MTKNTILLIVKYEGNFKLDFLFKFLGKQCYNNSE